MATAQLANNGYRIAKSWQYQDSNPLPDVNNSSDNNTPLNNNTLRPILMANYPPIQTQSINRSHFAGLKRDRERSRRKNYTTSQPLMQQQQLSTTNRHRKSEDDEMSGGSRCCFGFLVFIAQILLHGVVGLVLFWLIQYQSKGKAWPFSWKTDPELEFNLHPFLMILGFIYFTGQAMLMYRTCRCCRRIWSKLLHTTFHLLAAPCIAIAFVAVYDYKNDRVNDKNNSPDPIPHFYSIHSWMGLTTMGLFALQFIVGFFSFLLLLCCESATASFRAALVPIHSTFGITTFVMAIATACTGLTQKAYLSLSLSYSQWVPMFMSKVTNQFEPNNALQPLSSDRNTDDIMWESMTINVLAAALVGLVVVMPILVLHPKFRNRPQRIITVTHDRYG